MISFNSLNQDPYSDEGFRRMVDLLESHTYSASPKTSDQDLESTNFDQPENLITRMGALLESHSYSATSDVNLQDRKWTANELVELYFLRQTKIQFAEIAKSIKTHSVVDCENTYAKFSCEQKIITIRQKWSAGQKELLRILTSTKGKKTDYELIGQMLNHTPNACKKKAYELKKIASARDWK
jgi:hypothetical protein